MGTTDATVHCDLVSSHPPQLPLTHRPRLCRHQVPKRIRRIIPANAVLVAIHL
jgi:hypothetical protein